MGFGTDEAKRIIAQRDANRRAGERQIGKLEIVKKGRDRLWEDLNSEIALNIQDFVKELPNSRLRALRSNKHDLTVDRNVEPVIRLEITFDPEAGEIEVSFWKQYSDDVEPKRRVRFDVASDDRVVFAYNGSQMSPTELAEQLLTPVFHSCRV